MDEEPVLDCRGREIVEGSKVVIGLRSGQLSERTVKSFERLGRPEWWVNVRFVGGDYTTPERCVVVSDVEMRIKKLEIHPEDLLVISCDEHISTEALEYIAGQWQETQGADYKTIVVDSGLKLEALTKDQLAALGLQETSKIGRCTRCGNAYGVGGHGPGFCIDFIERLTPEERSIVEKLAEGADPWSIDPDHGCTNPLTGYFPEHEVELVKLRRETT